MLLPKNTTVAVADGTKLHLFRNTGDEANPKLTALPEPTIGGDNKGAGARHSSSPKPDDSRLEEDSFAAATADWLNKGSARPIASTTSSSSRRPRRWASCASTITRRCRASCWASSPRT